MMRALVIEDLLAEVRAIVAWNRDYASRETHDEIDRAAWKHGHHGWLKSKGSWKICRPGLQPWALVTERTKTKRTYLKQADFSHILLMREIVS
jgi:hypothetical protein